MYFCAGRKRRTKAEVHDHVQADLLPADMSILCQDLRRSRLFSCRDVGGGIQEHPAAVRQPIHMRIRVARVRMVCQLQQRHHGHREAAWGLLEVPEPRLDLRIIGSVSALSWSALQNQVQQRTMVM